MRERAALESTLPRGVPASGRISFHALRNGAPFGEHHVTFGRRGASLTVDTAIDYSVKVAFVTVFRYGLRAQEIWLGDVLQSAEAKTDNNGKPEFMKVQRAGGELIVEGSRARRYRAPDASLVASHWNVRQVEAPMINPQDATLLRYSLSHRRDAKIKDAAGRLRTATLCALAGDNPLELYYDPDDVWTALRAKAYDGSIIIYSAFG